MTPWDFSVNLKDFVIDFSLLGFFLLVGTVLRRYIPFFQRYLVPNSIIGGFLGLILGPQVTGLIDLDSDRLGQYIYHLLALTFIAIGLRQQKTRWGRGPLSKSLTGLSCYIIQAVIGLTVALVAIYTVKPDLFAAIGLLVPLGFGMGPGIAYTMGKSWEKYGFEGAGMIGLTFSVIGFMMAYFIGMYLVNRGINRGETTLISREDKLNSDIRTGIVKEKKPEVAGWLRLSPEAIEPLAFQVALIGFVYLLTFLFLRGMTTFMDKVGLKDFIDIIWSFHFVFALLLAVTLRKFLDIIHKSYVIDKGLMNRISGFCVDYLIVGSISAINIVVVGRYWLFIVVMSILAGYATYALIRFTSMRAFDDYHFERFVGIFGEMTGTLNSGLALVRVTDPEFKTPVAEDLAYGGGISLFLGLPLLFLLNVPLAIFKNSLSGYWITLGCIIVYFFVLWAIWIGTGFMKLRGEKG